MFISLSFIQSNSLTPLLLFFSTSTLFGMSLYIDDVLSEATVTLLSKVVMVRCPLLWQPRTRPHPHQPVSSPSLCTQLLQQYFRFT